MNRPIDPRTLAALQNLPLLAKTVVDGFMTGYHPSRRRGAGMEFSQYKSYQPGDDLRQLDWKMFARSDRYYIREAEVETGIAVRFVVDASASMGHRDEASDGTSGKTSKLEYARFLVAALAYLAHSQGDAVGLFVLTDEPPGRLVNLTPRHDARHLQRFWHQLGQLQPAGRFPELAASGIFAGKQPKELTVFVSDYYQRDREISALLGQLNARRNEVLCFHLMGRNETDFTYQGNLTFKDLETGQTIQVEAARLRKEYQEKVRAFLRTTREEMQKQQMAYQLLTLDQPLDEALRRFLTNRQRL